jgi:hypothetical protein
VRRHIEVLRHSARLGDGAIDPALPETVVVDEDQLGVVQADAHDDALYAGAAPQDEVPWASIRFLWLSSALERPGPRRGDLLPHVLAIFLI